MGEGDREKTIMMDLIYAVALIIITIAVCIKIANGVGG